MWDYEIWVHSPLTFVGAVHSTWPSHAMWHIYAPTFNKWHKKRNKKRKWHSTYWHMAQCEGVGWLLWWFALLKICDIRERNVTIRSEVWTMNIRSLGFRDIREWVILWGLYYGVWGVHFLFHKIKRILTHCLDTICKSYEGFKFHL